MKYQQKYSEYFNSLDDQYSSDRYIKSSLYLLQFMKQKEYGKLESQLSEFAINFFPKRSKVTTRKYFREVLSEARPRQMIILGHLYIELFINELIQSKHGKLKALEKSGILNSFYKKVKFLRIFDAFDDVEEQTILTINKMRNNFAHRLKYSIEDVDIKNFKIIAQHTKGLKLPQTKKGLVVLNTLTTKLIFWWIGLRLSEKHIEIGLLDFD